MKNKLNLRDGTVLEEAERKITVRVESSLRAQPLQGNFDFAHLKAIHKALFSRLYDWAGETRTVDIGKGIQFASARFLLDNAAKVFRDLERDHCLIGLPYEKAIEKLAYYLGEINVLHPFREGNGRAQRIFISYLAQGTGLSLDFSKCEAERMLEASKYSAIACDNSKFEAILRDISEPLTLAEQKAFLRTVSPAAYAVFERSSGIPDRTEELAPTQKRPAQTMGDWRQQIAQRRAEGLSEKKEPHPKVRENIER